MAVLPLREMFKMRSFELKKLEIKDDIPLYVTLDSLRNQAGILGYL